LGSGNAFQVDATARPAIFLVEGSDRVGQGIPPVAPSCGSGGVAVSGQPVAVAFDANAKFVVQSREPATLELEDHTVIRLSDVSHDDTGMAMFHMNTGGGMACSSCHPEGVEDGHTWSFSKFGLRRTQALAGGVGLGAPFHWSGDLATFDDLMKEVMISRMALPVAVSAQQNAALLDWLGRLEAPSVADNLDEQAVARGRTLFEGPSQSCFACHSGAMFTDDTLHDVGTGGEFVTPSLIGVGLRAPLMHDGCAVNLRARFGACGGGDFHGMTSKLSDAEIDDMVAFLRSL
jgi:mono/diheme cytochrome c family protein